MHGKFGGLDIWYLRYAGEQTDIQTYRRADRNAPYSTAGKAVMLYREGEVLLGGNTSRFVDSRELCREGLDGRCERYGNLGR